MTSFVMMQILVRKWLEVFIEDLYTHKQVDMAGYGIIWNSLEYRAIFSDIFQTWVFFRNKITIKAFLEVNF